MSHLLVPIPDLTEERLKRLVETEARESINLDFKRDNYRWNDEGTREFLADVSAFANTRGGFLVIGIDEEDGTATEVGGVEGDADQEVNRMIEKIRSGLDPSLGGVEIEAVQLESGDHVFVISIPRSWASPHMVTFKNFSRFFGRHSNGKYQMDVSDLRASFSMSSRIRDHLRTTRAKRLQLIKERDTTIPLREGRAIVVHGIPFSMVDQEVPIKIPGPNEFGVLQQPLDASSWGGRLTLDGLLTKTHSADGNPSYHLISRDGLIEAADVGLLETGEAPLPSTRIEFKVYELVSRTLDLMGKLSISPPLIWGISLLGVLGAVWARPNKLFHTPVYPFDRDDLIIPEFLQEDPTLKPGLIVKGLFDPIWQAVGVQESPNLNSAGDWVG